ncbi:hypothetical protein WJX74_006727 [Apatococcus lobatus]|uniref:F-box domain-containing protein n=1 Tax=Apatococcus lobatus TaxID=904363 RepID=A0AAW1QWD3_9CHLO
MGAVSADKNLADELLLALGDVDAGPEVPAQVRPAHRKRSRSQVQLPAVSQPCLEPTSQRQRARLAAPADASDVTALPEGLSSSAAGHLCHVPTELFMKVLGCLSAEELLNLTRVNSFFAKVASDQILWKRLCTCRWKICQDLDGSNRKCSWKEAYMTRDRCELDEKLEGAPEAMKVFLQQSIVGRRSERPNYRVSCGEDIARHSRPAQMGVQRPHTCLGPVTFRHVGGDCVACTVCGWVHVCDENCKERLIDRQSHLPVCPLSGRCFDRLMTEEEEEEDVYHGPPCERETGEDGVYGGRFAASAYLAGYNCMTEHELRMTCGVVL